MDQVQWCCPKKQGIIVCCCRATFSTSQNWQNIPIYGEQYPQQDNHYWSYDIREKFLVPTITGISYICLIIISGLFWLCFCSRSSLLCFEQLGTCSFEQKQKVIYLRYIISDWELRNNSELRRIPNDSWQPHLRPLIESHPIWNNPTGFIKQKYIYRPFLWLYCIIIHQIHSANPLRHKWAIS